MPIIAVNPFRCRVWDLHGRLEENLSEESCKSELESFEKHGQLIPVLGRRLQSDPDYDVELIYGARRLFVARQLSQPLLVELRDITDRDGIIAMELENRLRRDISPYERGLSYDRWLREGRFGSQREIAAALQLPPANVSRLVRVARLPEVVLEAFDKPSDIRETWGVTLANLLDDDGTAWLVTEAARAVAAVEPRPPAVEIYKRLSEAGKASKGPRLADRVVKDDEGEELFRIKHQRRSVVFSIQMSHLSQELLEELEEALVSIMDEDSWYEGFEDLEEARDNAASDDEEIAWADGGARAACGLKGTASSLQPAYPR